MNAASKAGLQAPGEARKRLARIHLLFPCVESRAGSILVSNFNNSANQQGTGTTIVQVAPDGSVSLFAQITKDSLPGAFPDGIGLTTALVSTGHGT